MLNLLKAASFSEATIFFVAANFGILVGSVMLCWLLGWLFRTRRLFDRWEPLRSIEVLAAVGSVFFNAGISLFGWWLWKQGLITLTVGGVWPGIRDALLMLLFMDFGMYVLHRLVHHPEIFPLFHRFHHRHETTNPISLFVLHPLEIAGFGLLMIAFLAIHPTSPGGLVGYLTLNVLWGTLGHSGVEPFPKIFRSIPGLRLLARRHSTRNITNTPGAISDSTASFGTRFLEHWIPNMTHDSTRLTGGNRQFPLAKPDGARQHAVRQRWCRPGYSSSPK